MDQKPIQQQPLWDKGTNVQMRLRQPRISQAPNLVNQEHSAPAETSFKGTVLNAEAPEFVPTWMKPPTDDIEYQFQNVHITVGDGTQFPKHSAQNRLNKFKTSNQSSSSEQSSSCYSNPPELVNGFYETDNSTDLQRLNQIISSLIKYPGQFDDLLMVFMETIYPYFNDIMTMSEIVKLLVGQAINSSNFRYNGVRLCWFVEQKCPTFRAELHLRCKKELEDNLNQQNVNLFIAELYTQLPHDSLYGSLLIESLQKLLMHGGNDNIKCVCQALKLTGYSLEQNEKQAFNELFIQLGHFKALLSGSALVLLNSVINLRGMNWGRSTVESSNSDSSDYEQDYEEMVNEILYETDGQALTSEEQAFLVANASQDEYIFDNEDPDGLCDPEPEMDEEIQAAFEEFVKLSKG